MLFWPHQWSTHHLVTVFADAYADDDDDDDDADDSDADAVLVAPVLQ